MDQFMQSPDSRFFKSWGILKRKCKEMNFLVDMLDNWRQDHRKNRVDIREYLTNLKRDLNDTAEDIRSAKTNMSASDEIKLAEERRKHVASVEKRANRLIEMCLNSSRDFGLDTESESNRILEIKRLVKEASLWCENNRVNDTFLDTEAWEKRRKEKEENDKQYRSEHMNKFGPPGLLERMGRLNLNASDPKVTWLQSFQP